MTNNALRYEQQLTELTNLLAHYNIVMEDENRREMFTSHMISLWDRIANDELIEEDSYADIMAEIKAESLEIAEALIQPFLRSAQVIPMMELVLVATHIQTYFIAKEEEAMDQEIIAVIGHRLGKGQAVARGVEKAGAKAIVIPGMAADMKLGDVMHEHQAQIGISFCGSGGAGAITAHNKYGYQAISHIRSIRAAVTAIEQGYDVIGLGFMDVEELGEKVVLAYLKRINNATK